MKSVTWCSFNRRPMEQLYTYTRGDREKDREGRREEEVGEGEEEGKKKGKEEVRRWYFKSN